jgi:hypothetical protein
MGFHRAQSYQRATLSNVTSNFPAKTVMGWLLDWIMARFFAVILTLFCNLTGIAATPAELLVP